MSRGLIATLAAVFLSALLAGGCPASRSRIEGPPPEYERPVVAPWDAGLDQDQDFDPFAAAAQGDWVGGEPEDAGATATGGASPKSRDAAHGGAAGSSP